MEQDADIKGEKLDYNTEYRQFDPRVGRWFSPDPVVKPWESPYAGFANNPIYYDDPFGLDPKYPSVKGNNVGEKNTTDGNEYVWNGTIWQGTKDGQTFTMNGTTWTWSTETGSGQWVGSPGELGTAIITGSNDGGGGNAGAVAAAIAVPATTESSIAETVVIWYGKSIMYQTPILGEIMLANNIIYFATGEDFLDFKSPANAGASVPKFDPNKPLIPSGVFEPRQDNIPPRGTFDPSPPTANSEGVDDAPPGSTPGSISQGAQTAGGVQQGVTANQGTGMHVLNTETVDVVRKNDDGSATKVTLSIPEGYKETGQYSHGQKVFYNSKNKTYISPDSDSHSGGDWKMAKKPSGLGSPKTRMGTYDKNLNRVGE